jgi:nucleoside-diphosphate-sugar epimerase
MPLDLVTGGTGLTGRSLVPALLAAGRQVRVLDLVAYPDSRVESVVGDVRDAALAERACQGVDTVFHTVALVSQHPGHAARLHDVNVGGTRVMLEASRRARVARFVFTSSMDVVFDGTAISNGDESIPYPAHFLDDYGHTKSLAEKAVLAANDPNGLATCSLRATGIFGPHDRNRFPVALDYIRRNGFISMGNGQARFSHVYVDNLAHAHVLAARALKPGSPVAGRAYFITDHEPRNFFDFIEPYFAELGIKRSRFAMPASLAWLTACAVEGLYAVLGRFFQKQPLLTRYTVAATCRDFWFNHAAATRDFGYRPIVSADEAYTRTMAWFRDYDRQRTAQPPASTGKSAVTTKAA